MQVKKWIRAGLVIVFVPIAVVGAPGVAQAGTIDVTTTADVVDGSDGVISLREAVNQASTTEMDIVSIPAGTYELECGVAEDDTNVSGDLDIIQKDITLQGPLSGTATIRPAAGCNERIIEIRDFTAPASTIVIERLTIEGGRPESNGGGIYAAFDQATSLTIRDSIITDNEAGSALNDAPSGGGIYLNRLGTLLIEGSTISNNSVGLGDTGGFGPVRGWRAGGGGVAFRGFSSASGGSVTIVDSTISGNTGGVASFGGGGGLWLETGDVTMTNVDVLNNNTAVDSSGRAAGSGAGVAITSRESIADMDVTIEGGTISGNTIGRPATNPVSGSSVDGGDGGGLWISTVISGVEMTGSVSIVGTTFEANQAGDGAVQAGGAGAGGRGGGIYISSSSTSAIDPLSIDIDGVTISGGRAGDGSNPGRGGGNGGGAFISTANADLGGAINITDTVVSNNRAGHGETQGEGGAGGGLALESASGNVAGSISIDGSTFTNNQSGNGAAGSNGDAAGPGGGVNARVTGALATDSPDVSVTVSVFSGNVAGRGGDAAGGGAGQGGLGGAIAINSTFGSVAGSTFTNNHAGDGGAGGSGGNSGRGGAIWFATTDAEVTMSTFDANVSGDGGAGSNGSGGRGGAGGAVMFDTFASVTVTGSTFADNNGGDGGSGTTTGGIGGPGGAFYIDNNGGTTIDVSDSIFERNTAGNGGTSSGNEGGPGGDGGGIAIRTTDVATAITLDGVTASQNRSGDAGGGVTGATRSGGRGGGVFVLAPSASASLVVTDSVIADNVTGHGSSVTGASNNGGAGGNGGGLFAEVGRSTDGAADAATVLIERSSITGNLAGDGGAGGAGGSGGRGGNGGGAWLEGGVGTAGTVTVVNTTVADNETGARPNGTGIGDGGGVHVNAGNRAEFTHATITGNSGGSGVNLLTDTAATWFTANVIGEGGLTGENCRIVQPTSTQSFGYNVETDADTCDLAAATDIVDIASPVLGPLADNGGVGLSRLPLVAGADPLAVLDRIPAGACSVATDQHGVARPQGAGCDAGAVEAVLSQIVAVDDVLRVGAGDTVIDFLANDDLQGFTPADIEVTVTLDDTSDQLSEDGGLWTYRARQASGAFTTFSYEACLGATDDYCDTATVTLIPEPLSRFVSLSPDRLFDTRPTEPGNGPKGFVSAGQSIDVQITGVAGVPTSGVSAVAMNITATAVEGPGFVTAYPTGSPRPDTSNLNFVSPGETVPNFVIVPIGDDGKVTLFSLVGAHLIADVAGYFTETGISQNAANPGSTSGRLEPLSPERVFDTRPTEPTPGPKGYVTAGSTIEVQVAGRAGVPETGVSAVVINLTATAADAPGFVTAFPAGSARPTASNLNLTGPGQTTPNLVIVPLGTDGKISLFSLGGTHLLGDVTGYFTDGSAPRSLSGLFAPTDPQRALDTREGLAPPGNKGFVDSDTTRAVRFTANAGVPASGAGAVMINATATGAAQPGFVTAWPDGVPRPTASTLNLSFAGQTRPNGAILPIGDGGRLAFYSFGGTDLLADVFGWFLE